MNAVRIDPPVAAGQTNPFRALWELFLLGGLDASDVFGDTDEDKKQPCE